LVTLNNSRRNDGDDDDDGEFERVYLFTTTTAIFFVFTMMTENLRVRKEASRAVRPPFMHHDI